MKHCRIMTALAVITIVVLTCTTFCLAESSSAIEMHEPNKSVYDFKITVAGTEVSLPMPYADLLIDGWKQDSSYKDLSTITIPTMTYFEIIVWKNNETMEIGLANLTDKEIFATECIIFSMRVENGDADIDYCGFTFDTTYENLDARLDPQSVDVNPDKTIVTLLSYDAYRSAGFSYTFTTDKSMSKREIELGFDKSDKLSYVRLQNVTPFEQAGISSNAVQESYLVPEALGTKLGEPIVEICGDLYRFPAPVSAFIQNGWTFLGYRVEAGLVQSDASSYAYLFRGDYYLKAELAYDGNAESLQDGIICGIENDISKAMVLSPGIKVGMSETEFRNISGMAEPSYQTSEYTDSGYRNTAGYSTYNINKWDTKFESNTTVYFAEGTAYRFTFECLK